MPAAIIGAIVAAGATAYSAAHAAKQKKDAQRKMQQEMGAAPTYDNPYSGRLLAETLTSKNAVSPALTALYQQAQVGAAGTMAQAERNAPSGATALAVGNAAQNNLQSLLPKIAFQQEQYNQQNKQNYYGALDKQTEEERMKYQMAKERNSDLVNFYLGQVGGYNATMNNSINSGLGALASIYGSYYNKKAA